MNWILAMSIALILQIRLEKPSCDIKYYDKYIYIFFISTRCNDKYWKCYFGYSKYV